MKKIILYDIDFTLIPFDSFLYFIFYILKKHPLKLFYFPMLFILTVICLFGGITLTKLKESWLIVINGISESKLSEYSKKFIEQKIIPMLKPGVEKEIWNYKKKGFIIIFATASFEFYFKYLADYFEVDYFFGTRTEIDGKKNKIVGINCKGKEKIRRILEKIDIDDIDRANSISYSDSNHDLPFLKLTRSFYKVHKKKWKIIKQVLS